LLKRDEHHADDGGGEPDGTNDGVKVRTKNTKPKKFL